MSSELSNIDLRSELKKYGVSIGPITESTRSVYLKKLEKLKAEKTTPIIQPTPSKIPKEATSTSNKKDVSPTPAVAPSAASKTSPVPGLANFNKSPSRKTPAAAVIHENGNSKKEDRFFDAEQADPGPPRKVTRRSIATTTVDSGTAAFRRGTDLSTTIGGVSGVSTRSGSNSSGISSTSTFASSAAGRRSLSSSTYQPTTNYSTQVLPLHDDEKWTSFRDSAFERLKETASNFGLGGLKKDTTPKPTSPATTKYGSFQSDSNTSKYGSYQNDSISPKYGSFQNENVPPPKYGSSFRSDENVTPKYGSAFQKDKMNNSAADWYRSRLHDGGSWTNQSYSTGVHSAKRRWWHLNANTSRWILYIFGGFVALLAVLYALILNKDSVKFFCILLFGAFVDTGYFVYNHMILPALIVLLIAGLIVGAIWYKRHKWHKSAEEQQQIFDMVEKILALLKKHYEECLLDNNRQPYLAVPHVRDMLIPPGKRKQMLPIWEKAVQYLNENESRVRTENQIISGEEFMVWRWLQSAADEKLWQGHAFPEEQAALNSPLMPFSECLKLRGLFDPDLEEDDDWPEHIQDAILEKLGQGTRVMHVAIDTESKEGCVYMKLGSKEEAGAAYHILHGSWFNGRLVTVKYLRVERYHERFPEAQRCVFALRIKKPRYSLLG